MISLCSALQASAQMINFAKEEFHEPVELEYWKSHPRDGIEVLTDEYGSSSVMFRYPISFLGAQFHCAADFRNAQFDSTADFSLAQFDSTADFSNAQFDSESKFIGARFYSTAFFVEAQFDSESKFICARFDSTAYFENARFFSAADFSRAQFHSAAVYNWGVFDSTANFRNAQFDSTADFFDGYFHFIADFSLAQFQSTASFKDAHFDSAADFSRTQFHSAANFNNGEFHSTAYFNSGEFHSTANFNSREFHSTADYRYTEFDSSADFRNAQFYSTADFRYAQFVSTADFRYAEFDPKANFREAQFNGKVSFKYAKLSDRLDFREVIDIAKEIDFTSAYPPSENKKCYIALAGTNIDKIKINMRFFEIWFPVDTTFRYLIAGDDTSKVLDRIDRSSYDERVSVYESVLKKLKDDGFLDSYRLLDIEYREFKYKIEGGFSRYVENTFQRWWWNYGYTKELIFLWALGFLFLFSVLNIIFYQRLSENVYDISFLGKWDYESMRWPKRWIYYWLQVVTYTAIIFFGLKMDIAKFKQGVVRNHPLLFVYLMFIYVLGLICMGFIVNIIFTR